MLASDMRWRRATSDVLVPVPPERAHSLMVEEDETEMLLRAVVVKRLRLDDASENAAVMAALRNAGTVLHGLRMEGSRLFSEVRLPKAGLTAEEFQCAARHLARECDRLEYLLTGEDRERGEL